MSDAREHVHEMINRLPPSQLAAVAGLLETMLEPPSEGQHFEDERISAEEEETVARSKEWFKQNDGIPFEDLVAEMGFTMEQIRNNREPV